MAIVAPAIETYLRKVQAIPTKVETIDDAVIAEMGRVGDARGFPIIGPLVGRLCEQLARSIGAKTVFEMGSGFGYSTAWFARAVGPKGRVVHTETDPKKSAEAKEFLTRAKLVQQVEFRFGDAVNILRDDRGPYDIVFIDIDKEAYPTAWKLASDRVRIGGLVITDNTLWHGKVAGTARDATTKAVREYNALAMADPKFLTTILPLRDGVGVSLRLK